MSRATCHVPRATCFNVRRATCHVLAAVIVALAGAQRAWAQGDEADQRVLRVCADPNNLPFSNRALEGFENKLAELLASDLGARLEYMWWPQRRGFVRNTLNAGSCDVVMGVPYQYELTLTTHPYYTSTYVFVTQRARKVRVTSLDDPRLRSLRIGVQLVGDDFASSPPGHALAARGLVSNIVGYSVLGDYSKPNPPARIVDAVERGDVDVAIVWGPLAGYFASRASVPLDLRAVAPPPGSKFPFTFAISMGVRPSDKNRVARLNSFLERRRRDIERILDEYGVPRGGAAHHPARRNKS